MNQLPTKEELAEFNDLVVKSTAMMNRIMEAVNSATNQSAGKSNRRGIAVAEQVARLTGRWFGFSYDALRCRRKTAAVVWARQVGMFFCMEFTVATTVEIGRVFQRHHGCVPHSIGVVQDRIATDPRTATDLMALRKDIEKNIL